MTMGTLIGFAVGGIAGAAVATAALLIPAGLVVYTLGRMWRRFAGSPWREPFARAVPPVIVALLWGSVIAISRGALDSPVTYAFAAGALALMLFTKLNQAALMLIAGGVVGTGDGDAKPLEDAVRDVVSPAHSDPDRKEA